MLHTARQAQALTRTMFRTTKHPGTVREAASRGIHRETERAPAAPLNPWGRVISTFGLQRAD